MEAIISTFSKVVAYLIAQALSMYITFELGRSKAKENQNEELLLRLDLYNKTGGKFDLLPIAELEKLIDKYTKK